MTDLPKAVIEPHRVLIDGQELPGFITEDGVSVIPGGHRPGNQVQVTFLCGEVTVEDAQNFMELCDGSIVKDTQGDG